MKGPVQVLLTLCIGLAVAQAAAKVVGLLIVLSAVIALIARPREMIALAVAGGTLNLAATHPLPVLGLSLALAALHWHSRKATGISTAADAEGRGLARITDQKDA